MGKKLLIGLAAGIILLGAFQARAATLPSVVYVDATMSDDTGNGLTALTAKKFIQSGVNLVAEGGTVNVAAGTYNEAVTVNESLTIRGPNAGINPNTGSRGDEAILNSTSTSDTMIRVLANDVTIDGLTFDGTAVGSTSAYAISNWANKAGWDANNGVLIDDLTVQNCIIKNLTEPYSPWGAYPVGIMIAAQYVAPRGVVSGILITANKFDNIYYAPGGTYNAARVGGAVSFMENTSGTVSNNVITNVSFGILSQRSNVGSTVISGNSIQSFFLGIRNQWDSVTEVPASTTSITNNILTPVTSLPGYPVMQNQGIQIYGAKPSGTQSTTISGNTMTGNRYGVQLFGAVAGSGYGSVTITNNAITGCTASAAATGVIPAGVRIAGTFAPALGAVTIHNNNLSGNQGELSTGYGVYNALTTVIDATNNWWGSADLATITSKISGSVTFGPYYVDAEKTALSNSIKAITDFHVEDQEGATAINEKKHTIKLVLFNDNDEDNSSIKTLKTTFTTTGASVKVGTTLQVSGTTANDFTDHVTYTVTAEDASTQDYTVTITEVAKDPITPDEDGKAETTKERPQVVITDTTKPVTITVSDATENPTINVSTLIVDGTGTLPQITVNTSTANIAIAESTIVTSVTSDPGGPVWDGVIAAPTITVVTLPETTGETKTPGTAIEIGFTGGTLFFTKAVRISFPGEAGKRAGHTRPGEPFSEITTICGANTQDWADTLAADGDCKIDVGSDLVIWTMHFTKYALYTETATPAATGDSGGGGCFIATAVFGSYQERHVWVLRQFRDQFLLTNTAGKAFVSFYYQHSPVLANWIAEREWVKAVTRILLLPLYGIAYLLINGLGWVLLAGLLLAVAIFIATQHLKSAGKTNLESRATLAGMVIGLFNALATRRYLGIAGFRKQV